MALMWWIPFRLFISRICYPGAHSFCSIRRLTDRGALVDTRAMALRKAGLAGEGLRLAVVAVAYFVSARLSLELALVHGQVTPVWPPTGIALVAILVFGGRIWPAIAVAALAVNLPLGPNVLGAVCIAAGNTLAPLAAATLMKSVGFRLELDRLIDAAALILLGALTGMAVSATVGSLVLVISGSVASDSFPQAWAVWWTGDAMGVLLVAPFLLTFRRREGQAGLAWRERSELAALLIAVAVASFIVFQNSFRVEYLVFPLIMLAALRFRLRGSAPAALIASGVAVLAAVHGTGPCALASPRASMDLHDVVRAAVERARPRAALTRGEIVAGKGQAITVMADADQLGHVMDNLINNALSYARPPARIAISSAIEAGRAVVRISDNGAGISEELRARLFEPFRRR